MLNDLHACNDNLLAPHSVTPYKLSLKMTPALPSEEIFRLEKWRALLYRLGFFSPCPTREISYGHLSHRLPVHRGKFVITGFETLPLAHLTGSHYTRILECDQNRLSIKAEGPIAPASTSFTHFALYQENPKIQCIFQLNAKPIKHRHRPSPILSLIEGEKDVWTVMGEHKEILVCSTDSDVAGKVLLKLYRESVLKKSELQPQPF